MRRYNQLHRVNAPLCSWRAIALNPSLSFASESMSSTLLPDFVCRYARGLHTRDSLRCFVVQTHNKREIVSVKCMGLGMAVTTMTTATKNNTNEYGCTHNRNKREINSEKTHKTRSRVFVWWFPVVYPMRWNV